MAGTSLRLTCDRGEQIEVAEVRAGLDGVQWMDLFFQVDCNRYGITVLVESEDDLKNLLVSLQEKLGAAMQAVWPATNPQEELFRIIDEANQWPRNLGARGAEGWLMLIKKKADELRAGATPADKE